MLKAMKKIMKSLGEENDGVANFFLPLNKQLKP